MDMPNFLVVLTLLPFLFPSLSSSATTGNAECSRSCGVINVSFPFSFTPSCGGIQLNCSDGDVRVGDFRVRNITAASILIDVPANCTRLVSDTRVLFSDSFAMTAKNTLLLRNCSESSSSSSSCNITYGLLPHRFENDTCPGQGNENATCVNYKDDAAASDHDGGFLSLANIAASNCSTFLTSITIQDAADNLTSVLVHTLELGWWLPGDCNLCHVNASCVPRNSSADAVRSHRGVNCLCKKGLVGDGFVNGTGCQAGVAEASNPRCGSFKYMWRSCREDSSSKAALLVAGIICGAVLMAVIAAVAYFIRKHSTVCRSRKCTRRLMSEASCTVPLYPYREIARATDNFSERNRLGTGAYGTVYVGRLHNDEEVAIKKLRHSDNDGIEQVLNEMKLLSSVSHPNLVRLLGCCLEAEEQILVYEFMPNGTLSQHLQRERGQGLPWTVRLNIASDTAKALAHLHSAIHPPIYHRDIKSSNILLDHDFSSKIADFGLSKMIVTESSHVSTAPQGTPGYLDPQYHQNFHLSDKSDVYSFGVVLVEIITAMKVVDFSRGQSDVNLAALAVNKIARGCVEDIIDPFLDPNRDAWTLSSIHKVAELAFRCLAFHRDMRPSMMEVAEELEQIRMSAWAPADDGILATTASSICSSPSNRTDRSQVSSTLKTRRLVCVTSMENQARGCSPVSMDDPWRSEQSSPSADSLLGSTTR